MPTPTCYRRIAGRISGNFWYLFSVGIGGFGVWMCVGAIYALLQRDVPGVVFSFLFLLAVVIAVHWLLLIDVVFFDPARGLLNPKQADGAVMATARFLLAWNAALVLDFGFLTLGILSLLRLST